MDLEKTTVTDWDVFREAANALLTGQNPYLIGDGETLFFNPPWTLIPLIPLAILPPMLGLLANAGVTIAVLLLVSRHLKLSLWEFFFMAISPMLLQSMLYGNTEWMPMLGLLFPPPIAMLFFATKPQAALGWILLFLHRGWKTDRWKGIGFIVAPTIVLTIASLLIWGLPPIPGPENPGQRSLFPFSLLVGIPVLIWVLRKDDDRLAGFVGPFTAPYVTFHGYVHALFPFRGKWMALAVAASFIPVVLGIVA